MRTLKKLKSGIHCVSRPSPGFQFWKPLWFGKVSPDLHHGMIELHRSYNFAVNTSVARLR